MQRICTVAALVLALALVAGCKSSGKQELGRHCLEGTEFMNEVTNGTGEYWCMVTAPAKISILAEYGVKHGPYRRLERGIVVSEGDYHLNMKIGLWTEPTLARPICQTTVRYNEEGVPEGTQYTRCPDGSEKECRWDERSDTCIPTIQRQRKANGVTEVTSPKCDHITTQSLGDNPTDIGVVVQQACYRFFEDQRCEPGRYLDAMISATMKCGGYDISVGDWIYKEAGSTEQIQVETEVRIYVWR